MTDTINNFQCEHCGRTFDSYRACTTYAWKCPDCSYSIVRKSVIDNNPSHPLHNAFPASRGTTVSELNQMMVAAEAEDTQTDLLKKQVGGSHYKDHGTMQPWCIIEHYKLNYWEGSALKYILRSKDPKKRSEDLRKAAHCLEYIAAMLEKNHAT